jgi:uncharacterized protein YjbJ (UPF0337 family)
MDNMENFETKWGELRKHIKPRWMALTDADIETIDGKVDVLIELLREKYGYTEAQATEQVKRFLEESEIVNAPKPM